uniref:Uncharacterized protein n=1 Tax=Peronospora matthiolae TaxID=2874970 RepID=A0AAV1UJ28_9STRA
MPGISRGAGGSTDDADAGCFQVFPPGTFFQVTLLLLHLGALMLVALINGELESEGGTTTGSGGCLLVRI